MDRGHKVGIVADGPQAVLDAQVGALEGPEDAREVVVGLLREDKVLFRQVCHFCGTPGAWVCCKCKSLIIIIIFWRMFCM